MTPDNSVLNRCLFYGCWDDKKGHFLVDRYNQSVRECDYTRYGITFKAVLMDGFLLNVREQSKVILMQLPGWSIIDMGDFTADKRPGSHAVFMVPIGGLSFSEILEIIQIAFPEQVERIQKAKPMYIEPAQTT